MLTTDHVSILNGFYFTVNCSRELRKNKIIEQIHREIKQNEKVGQIHRGLRQNGK